MGDLTLDIMKSLNKNMEDMAKNTGATNDRLKEMNNAFYKMNKDNGKSVKEIDKNLTSVRDTYSDIEKQTKKNTDATNKYGKAIGGIVNSTKQLIQPLIGLFSLAAIVDFAKQALTLTQTMTDLSYRMGQGGKNAAQLAQDVYDVSYATGASAEKTRDMIKALVEMRVPAQGVRQLATDALRYSEITGASAESTGRLIGELSNIPMGTKNIGNLLGSIVQAQRAFGLTEGEVDKMNDSISLSARQLTQMGKSSAFVSTFAKGTIKLAAAFSSVGVSAEEANKFVEDLLDPGKIEDNALLYAKLGVSIQDVIEGNVDPGQLTSKFKDLGAELKNMGGPAAAALAQQLGMPLSKLRQMAGIDMNGLEKGMKNVTNGSEAMANQQAQQATASRELEHSWERIKSTLGNLVNKFMPVIQQVVGFLTENVDKITGWINGVINGDTAAKFFKTISEGAGKIIEFFKKGGLMLIAIIIGALIIIPKILKAIFHKKSFASLKTGIQESITEGITAGLGSSSEKRMKIFTEKVGMQVRENTEKRAEDLKGRIMKTAEFSSTMMAAEYYKVMSNTSLLVGKKMAANAGMAMEAYAMGSKPISKLEGYEAKSNKMIKEKLEISKQNYSIENNYWKSREEMTKKDLDANKERLAQIHKIKQANGGNLDPEYLKEQKHLIDQRVKMNAEVLKHQSKQKSENELIIEQQKYFNRLSVDELDAQRKIVDFTKSELLAKKKTNEEQTQGLFVEERILSKLKSNLEATKANLMIKEKNGSINTEELNHLLSIKNEESRIKEELLQIQSTKNSIIEENKEYAKQLKAEESMLERINDAQNSKGSNKAGDADRSWKSSGRILTDAGDAIRNKIANAGDVLFENARRSGRVMKEAFTDGAKRLAHPIKSLRALGEGSAVKGAGKAIKGAFKGGAKVVGGAIKGAMSIAGSGLGKAALIGGGVLGLAGMIGGMMNGNDKTSAGMEEIMNSFKSTIGDLLVQLMPTIKTVSEILITMIQNIFTPQMMTNITDFISQMVPFLMPIFDLIGNLMKALLPAFMQLVKILMPPMLKSLSFLLNVLGTLSDGIGSLVSTLPGLGDVGKGIANAGKAMVLAAGSMDQAAENMKNGKDGKDELKSLNLTADDNRLNAEYTKTATGLLTNQYLKDNSMSTTAIDKMLIDSISGANGKGLSDAGKKARMLSILERIDGANNAFDGGRAVSLGEQELISNNYNFDKGSAALGRGNQFLKERATRGKKADTNKNVVQAIVTANAFGDSDKVLKSLGKSLDSYVTSTKALGPNLTSGGGSGPVSKEEVKEALYAGSVEASNSGFVKTQDAYISMSKTDGTKDYQMRSISLFNDMVTALKQIKGSAETSNLNEAQQNEMAKEMAMGTSQAAALAKVKAMK